MKTIAKALMLLSVSSFTLTVPSLAMESVTKKIISPEEEFIGNKINEEVLNKRLKNFFKYVNVEKISGELIKNLLVKDRFFVIPIDINFSREKLIEYIANNWGKDDDLKLQLASIGEKKFKSLLNEYLKYAQGQDAIVKFESKKIFKFTQDNNSLEDKEKKETLDKIKNKFYSDIFVISGNKVGNELLKRILNELNKDNKDLNLSEDKKAERDNLKSLKADFISSKNKAEKWSFSKSKSSINFSDEEQLNDPKHKFYFIDEHKDDGFASSSTDIFLFHEMLHWYHSLKDVENYDKKFKEEDFYTQPEIQYFFGGPKFMEIRSKVMQDWGGIEDTFKDQKGEAYTLEEIKTVLGTANPVFSGTPTLDKVELTENAFRWAGGYKIRKLYKPKANSEDLSALKGEQNRSSALKGGPNRSQNWNPVEDLFLEDGNDKDRLESLKKIAEDLEKKGGKYSPSDETLEKQIEERITKAAQTVAENIPD